MLFNIFIVLLFVINKYYKYNVNNRILNSNSYLHLMIKITSTYAIFFKITKLSYYEPIINISINYYN